MKIYIAGKLWEEKDRKIVENIDKFCKKLGYETFLPHRDAGIYDEKKDPIPIFKKDSEMIDWCDVMVAVLDWKDISSGTAWEVGYAYAKKIPIIGLVEDIKSTKKDYRMCVMCFNSVRLVESLDELKEELLSLKV